MIILDPDLAPESPHGRRPVHGDPEPDPAPKATLAKRASALSSRQSLKQSVRDVWLPTARTLARFLATAQAAVRLKGQVTVLLTTDAAIRRLNRQFRGKNKATDVLSFPAEGLGAEGMAGDLAISVTTALGQAAEQGHSLATEIKVLMLHGLLHLAGYDHEVDEGQMARRERALRGKLGLPQGLIERAAVPVESAVKGQGLVPPGRRAARGWKKPSALAAGGMQRGGDNIPQGLKPKNSSSAQLARLKSGPFKAATTVELAKKAKSSLKVKRS